MAGENSVKERYVKRESQGSFYFLWLKNVSRFHFMRHLIKRANFFLSFNGGCRRARKRYTREHTQIQEHTAM